MIVNNSFKPGDIVWWNSDQWEVVTVRGNLCLLRDMSEINQEEVHFTELEIVYDSEDESNFDDLEDIPEDGHIESRGMLFCYACGMLAQPGNEDYDWCDHKTGDDCPYMHDMDGGHEDDDYPYVEDIDLAGDGDWNPRPPGYCPKCSGILDRGFCSYCSNFP